jgi:hypothetical protein
MTSLMDAVLDSRKNVNADFRAQEVADTQHATDRGNRTVDILAKLYRLGYVTLNPDNASDWREALIRNGLSGAGDNPWHYVIIMGVGELRTKDGRERLEWEHRKTFVNRAPVLRAMASLKVIPTEAERFIGQFVVKNYADKFPEHLAALSKLDTRGIEGLRRLDSIVNAKAGTLTEDDYARMGSSQEPIDLDAKLVTDSTQQFVMVWARVDNGVVVPMGVVDKSANEARKRAIAAGKVVERARAAEDLITQKNQAA